MKGYIDDGKEQMQCGELYLFHCEESVCPAESSLWGVYDRREDGMIYLENSTLDHCHFRMWYPLPVSYRFYRLATRSELRDYMYNLGFSDGVSSSEKRSVVEPLPGNLHPIE